MPCRVMQYEARVCSDHPSASQCLPHFPLSSPFAETRKWVFLVTQRRSIPAPSNQPWNFQSRLDSGDKEPEQTHLTLPSSSSWANARQPSCPLWVSPAPAAPCYPSLYIVPTVIHSPPPGLRFQSPEPTPCALLTSAAPSLTALTQLPVLM